MMFDNLISEYLIGFSEKGEPYLKTLANCIVPSKIIRMKYKELPPLESLPYSQRKELWQYANDVYPDETIVFKKQFCQITYTIGTLI